MERIGQGICLFAIILVFQVRKVQLDTALCGEPPKIKGATIHAIMRMPSADDEESTVGLYFCDENPLAGSSTITCGPDGRWGQWSNKNLFCRPSCGPPPTIPRATISEGENLEGTTRTYSCLQNTVIRGTTTITCGLDGQWSKTNLQCRSICGEPPRIERATISAGENVEGTTRTYACNQNTSTEGNTLIKCGPDGQWSSTNLYCRPFCRPPPKIWGATISKGDNLQGTTRTYSCLQNTVMKGTPTITCGVDGQWSKTDLHCRRKRRRFIKSFIKQLIRICNGQLIGRRRLLNRSLTQNHIRRPSLCQM
ncbi:sushi, von Willebrand factor type A, EGF and pentraxin domain-containing protein 1-like [Ostrea edulis]|uniref:sushi, von Willebrand factor type A, EGF and pentraxin domain-containing protein 1-like n=1 Tax=Ostrea edulis TaxID=37623 RepID=UPI0024AF6916|nr:sushi, von Willebrand factor type A, EGF and pentraxin domain-containing protein 1-like [Ostrea edulis]XP_048765844.2 sushi, von Willebrand factor type A, EGF and pentraxin domain-containing protein 1-like [Ostrea edulis]XP_056017090.1 sushi, von Willebrand factor type A, EGF and pentraxin domain-containing protein 1-like [Ostrea edulis]